MKPEIQQQINNKLLEGEKLIDQSITPLCEAASMAILERYFMYGINLATKAQAAEQARSSIHGGIIELKDIKKPSEPKP